MKLRPTASYLRGVRRPRVTGEARENGRLTLILFVTAHSDTSVSVRGDEGEALAYQEQEQVAAGEIRKLRRRSREVEAPHLV
jgi:hypothetical protein